MNYKIALLVALAISPVAASAGTRDDVVTGVMSCAAIKDDRMWLECFYGSAQPMRHQLGLPPAPQTQTNLVRPNTANASPYPAAPPLPPRVQPPGFEEALLGRNIIVNKIPASSYSFDENKRFTVTLANGEVWRQVNDDPHARWKGAANRYIITIKGGFLGSNNLEVAGDSNLYKVQRIQ